MDKATFIENYLERIGYTGSRDANLENLTKLQTLHITNIPFENTYVLAKMPITLTKDWIYEKVIVKRRGGLCYELNYLFNILLSDLGYDAKLLGGTVLIPGSSGLDNEHILSLVKLGDTNYVADVAFGGKCASTPLPLVYDKMLDAPNGIFRYAQMDDGHVRFECKPKTIIDIKTNTEVQNTNEAEWTWVYRFKLQPIGIADVKPGYEFHTTHEMSPFTKGPYNFKLTKDGKVTMTGNLLTVYTAEGNMKDIKGILKGIPREYKGSAKEI